ncbi:DUF2147 domain-containing protein [Runella sp. MFBS21]|uniref:DUF2147 domain-containing protein n=1 Tax=Runella sp. MFBS21 TaxID=3034018 RepID=UPI0023F92465|nr:DUF2147 domain-containing protein [Runella sp. MFBS21]MCA0233123.1 DUF2147 domain-containing protein [Bacteroidota bacterium]MDF7821247.1 DUF2147 domain-containing protein [Runella sp. MFBS21]
MKTLFILATLLLLHSEKSITAEQIIGKWMSEDKDIAVEIFKKNNSYSAQVIWFLCDPKTPEMRSFKDIENPDPKLRNRPWLGMLVVNDLKFDGKSEWKDGNIYDPNSGRTYKSVVRLQSPDRLIVRGYWGIELFGKSLTFNKIQ